MFAAVAPTPNVNYFDLVVIAWLLVGLLVGRKRGMTQEFLPALQWIAIVVLGALFYQPLAGVILESTGGAFDRIWSNVTAYCIIGFAIHLLTLWLKDNLGQRLNGSDLFGKWEYYFGMTAGCVRFACILIALCALMNVRIITAAELAETDKMQKREFEGIQFPTYGSVQHAVLAESMSGRFIEDHLRAALVTPVPAQKAKGAKGPAPKPQKNDVVVSVMGGAT